MGSMSASDAAPLPRLGEVYFDVRGESRSMRLSWYADTGVAVFSIWQGGTCTGTFRLPIADLPRMIQALQRGPDGDAEDVAGPPVAGQAQRGSPARDLRPGMAPSAGLQPGMPSGVPEPGVPLSGVPQTGVLDGAPPASPSPFPGQRAAAADRPRSGRHHGDDRAPAGYGVDAVSEYGAEPGAVPPPSGRGDGYPGELDAGYSGARSSRHRDELTAEYGQAPGAGYSGSRRSGEHRAAGYSEDPAAARRDADSEGYDAPAGVYREPDSGGYGAPPGAYREADSSGYDAPTGVYQEADSGGYGAPPGAYREADSGGYGAPPGAYREADSGGRHSEGSHRRGPEGERAYSGGDRYGLEPTGPYPEDRLGYHGDRTAAYSHGAYEDEPTGIYHGDLLDDGFKDEPGGRYGQPGGRHPAGEYPGDPRDSDYPTGPSGPGYLDATGPRDYPAPSRDPGYSSARPYVAPGSGGTAREEGAPRSRRRRDDDPAPESFPYGPPPSEREVRGRAR